VLFEKSVTLAFGEVSSLLVTLERKVALVNLYKALVGGWMLSDPQWFSPPPSQHY
jgi:hypothetical protein